MGLRRWCLFPYSINWILIRHTLTEGNRKLCTDGNTYFENTFVIFTQTICMQGSYKHIQWFLFILSYYENIARIIFPGNQPCSLGFHFPTIAIQYPFPFSSVSFFFINVFWIVNGLLFLFQCDSEGEDDKVSYPLFFFFRFSTLFVSREDQMRTFFYGRLNGNAF